MRTAPAPGGAIPSLDATGPTPGTAEPNPGAAGPNPEDLDGRHGPFEFVAATASKTHVDAETPRGVGVAYYRVRTRLTNGKVSQWTAPMGVPYGPLRGTRKGEKERVA